MNHWPPPLKVDAAAADQMSAIIDAWRDRLRLDSADVEWGRRVIEACGHAPPITSAKQCHEYRRRLSEILTAKLGRHGGEQDVFAAFVRTDEGALALALATRIQQWQQRPGAIAALAGKILGWFKGEK